MLESFEVKNFRLFKRLEARQLGRVNLLVGQNNSGKSALLEAIEVYVSNGAPRTLMNLISAREETWYGKAQEESRRQFGNPLRHLFYGHRLPDVGGEGVTLGPGSKRDEQLHITTAAFKTITTEGGIIQRRRLSPSDLGHADGEDMLGLIAQEGDRERLIVWLNRERDYQDLRLRARSGLDIEAKCPIQVVPTRNMSANHVANLWDSLGLTDLASEVYEGLNLIDRSKITGIQFVENTVSSRERVALARTPGVPEPLPLRSMGDGTTRLFQIILALVSAKDGVLLIDEFENGLHWSVQGKAWKTIFRLAGRLNVQVFATTHSRDCIRGFAEAWEQDKDNGTFMRLTVGLEGQVRAKLYAPETLADALETEVEIR
jgi:predicted ATPase